MTIYDDVAASWKTLCTEPENIAPGIYERRIPTSSAYSVHAAIEQPAGTPRVHLTLAIPFNEPFKLELKGISLALEATLTGETRAVLRLLRQPYAEIFALLVADVLAKTLTAPTPPQALRVLLSRLTHWQRFLERAGPDGLTLEQQAGLFGELLLLRALLEAGAESTLALGCWRGPSAANHDFSHQSCCIEVKTSTSNDTESVTLSNEFQLDDLGLTALFLCHISLDRRPNSGVTLPELVKGIETQISSDAALLLEDKLVDAGYLAHQHHLYSGVGYVERGRTFYQVADAFPRLIRKSLPNEISQVSYRLHLAACKSYRAHEAEAVAMLLGARQ